MQREDTLVELIDLVKNIGKICDEEGVKANIDFDPNDGIILIKYQNESSGETTCIINSNNKTISGIDTTNFWLPDYFKTQKLNKKMLNFLEKMGYHIIG